MPTKTTTKTTAKAKPAAKAHPAKAPAKKVEKAEKVEKKLEKVVVEVVEKISDKKTSAGDTSRAVGRRKRASARVRISIGKGEIVVNGQPLKKYFPYFAMQEAIISPLKAMGKENSMNVSVKVQGGGKKGQADAIKHGIARALVAWNTEFKKTLKTLGLLTRDARIKERKKFGLKRARRAPQWSKR
jgi:small subunit ribosomal protein S9